MRLPAAWHGEGKPNVQITRGTKAGEKSLVVSPLTLLTREHHVKMGQMHLREGNEWANVFLSRRVGFARSGGADILTICDRKSTVPEKSSKF